MAVIVRLLQGNEIISVGKIKLIILVLLLLFRRLRRSEVLGLRWNSINFNNNTITINNTVTYINCVIAKERTKNNQAIEQCL